MKRVVLSLEDERALEIGRFMLTLWKFEKIVYEFIEVGEKCLEALRNVQED